MEDKGYKWYIIGVVFLGITLGIILGIYLNRGSGISDTNIISIKELAYTNENMKEEFENKSIILETASTNDKISPNANIIEKRYYKLCDHIIKEEKKIDDSLINKKEEDVKSFYKGWNIESYNPLEIVVYKEFNDICNEHYILKEHNGVVAIYTENKDGAKELKEDTGIDIKYLPKKDQEDFKEGIKIVGNIELNEFLEDYE